MKKAYIQPTTEVLKLSLHGLLMASGVQSDKKDIGYGGVDEEGDHDPAARRRRDVWSEESEEEE